MELFGEVTSQDEFTRRYSGWGMALTGALYLLIVGGFWLLVPFFALLLTVGVFGVLRCEYELSPEIGDVRKIYCRGQSPSFMAGPFLITPALTLTSIAYANGDIAYPVWLSHQWQWALLGVVTMVVFGYVFRLVDNPRYINQGAGAMLDSPTCWWIRRWQMPIGAGIVVATVVPVLLSGSRCAPSTAGFLGLWVAIAAVEVFFPPNIFVQHNMWCKREFRVMTKEEAEAYTTDYFAQRGQ